jgi:mannosyltransferase OCH1-like enzyme
MRKYLFLLLFPIIASHHCFAARETIDTNEFPLFAPFERFLPHVNTKVPIIALIKTLYERNCLSRALLREKPRIPKIIHQIWLGGPVPERFKAWMQTWKTMHPDWRYVLWTDDHIRSFSPRIQELLSKTRNLGQKADILRYEILYQFGGLYVDVDFECRLPFDLLHHCYDFYAGCTASEECVIIVNALMACAPHHPIMKAVTESIKEVRPESNFDICDSTGPFYLTRIFEKVALSSPGKNIIFPPTFFYPMKDDIKPETFGIHYWTASWTW